MSLKRRRLVWQLYPSYLLLILVVLLSVGWFVSAELRDFHYQRTARDLSARAMLVGQQVKDLIEKENYFALDALVRQLGRQSRTRITAILADGRVIADSQENAASMDNHGQRPEVKLAFSGETGNSVRFSNTLGQTMMYVAIPLHRGNRLVGSVRTALSVSDIDATLQSIYAKLLFGGLLLSVLLAPVCWWISSRLSRPLELMTAGAQRFSRGELDQPLELLGSEETRRLAAAMNRMAVDLAERIEREVVQRSEIEGILSSMIEGIVAVDNDEQIIRFNNAASSLLGLTPATGRSVQEMIRQAGLQRFIRRALDLQKPLEEELTLLLSQEKRHLHVLATPLIGGNQQRLGVLIMLHDLTRLRQLESVRRDFVANVSHELKTPITAIRGSVETLLDDARGTDRRFLEIINKQGGRLQALVEDLLELSRIEQGRIAGEEDLLQQPLLPVIHSSVAACENLRQEQQLELKQNCPEGIEAMLDAHLLEQALTNLLTNAFKYSDRGSCVELRSFSDAEGVKIQVQDFGCGIEKEHLPRLFERFYRVDRARSRQLGGTGLGLAIVKHVIHAHNGEVRVESTPGQGTTFTLLLPHVA